MEARETSVSQRSAYFSNGVTIVASMGVLAMGAFGVYSALRSNLFVIQAIDIRLDEKKAHVNAPLTVGDIRRLSGLRVGEENLFGLSLDEVEERIEAHPWIRSVTLSKQFPQTLVVDVKYERAVGLIQGNGGKHVYLSAEGERFGELDVSVQSDLPVVHGIEEDSKGFFRSISRLIQVWNFSRMNEVTQLSSLTWDPERGFRAEIVYFIPSQARLVRARLDLGLRRGQISDSRLGDQLGRLARVIGYLREHEIGATRLLVAGRQKIVVKTDRRS